MKRRLWITAAVLAVLVLVGAYFTTPLLAFHALGRAAENGDRGRLERLVDFPALRASLKDQLRDRLIGALQTDPALGDSPFGALGALLGPSIVDQVVDTAVTPDGVAAIVRSGRAPLADVSPRRGLPPPQAVPDAAAKPKRETRFAFLDANHFKATTTVSEAPDAPLGWVMERRGLFGWKLVRIELPQTEPAAI